MIEDEDTHCIYCRGLLLSDLEIKKQYHIFCRQDFQIGTSNFEYFNELFINEFIESISKDISWKKKQTIFLVLLTSVFYALSIFLNTIVGAIITCILILVCVYSFGLLLKVDNIKHFCEFIISLKPQCQFLNKKYCVALKNGVFLISQTSLFELFDGFYIIKFPEPESILSIRVKVPGNPGLPFNSKMTDPIKFAISENMCQIPYNNRYSIKGMSYVVFIQNAEFSGSISTIDSILSTLNNPQLLQKYTSANNSLFFILHKLVFPTILFFLLLCIFLSIKNLSFFFS